MRLRLRLLAAIVAIIPAISCGRSAAPPVTPPPPDKTAITRSDATPPTGPATPSSLATLNFQSTRLAAQGPSSPAEIPTEPPMRSLSANGPWSVGHSQYGVWVSNPDGTAPTFVFHTNDTYPGTPPYALSPDGRSLAILLAPWPQSTAASDYSLWLFTLPSTSPALIVPTFEQEQIDYISARYPPASMDGLAIEETDYYARAQVTEAMLRPRSLAWSPDGSVLAFIGAIHGPTADVYTLDLQSREVRRLTSGPMQATDLYWSPDGQSLVHLAVLDFNLGRGGGTDIIDSLWAVSREGDRISLLVHGPVFPFGWASPRLFLASLSERPCSEYYLMLVDVLSADYQLLWRGSISSTWTDIDDFTIEVPPAAYDTGTSDPDFARRCPPPPNAPSNIDLTSMPDFVAEVLSSGGGSTILIKSHDGVLSFAEHAPTQTP